MEENTQEQHKKRYDWLKGYQFVKGVSANPGGRPKGSKSLKTFAREYLATLPEEEKIEFLKCLPEELVFRMAEGNPDTKSEVKTDMTINLAPEDKEKIKNALRNRTTNN